MSPTFSSTKRVAKRQAKYIITKRFPGNLEPNRAQGCSIHMRHLRENRFAIQAKFLIESSETFRRE